MRFKKMLPIVPPGFNYRVKQLCETLILGQRLGATRRNELRYRCDAQLRVLKLALKIPRGGIGEGGFVKNKKKNCCLHVNNMDMGVVSLHCKNVYSIKNTA